MLPPIALALESGPLMEVYVTLHRLALLLHWPLLIDNPSPKHHTPSTSICTHILLCLGPVKIKHYSCFYLRLSPSLVPWTPSLPACPGALFLQSFLSSPAPDSFSLMDCSHQHLNMLLLFTS